MKTTATLSLILALLTFSIAIAQPADTKNDHTQHHAASASATTYSTGGIVKKVDVAKGTVTFAHEPIPALNWPAMTMNFSVKDKALFSKLKVDQRVTIEFVQQNGDNIVTAMK